MLLRCRVSYHRSSFCFAPWLRGLDLHAEGGAWRVIKHKLRALSAPRLLVFAPKHATLTARQASATLTSRAHPYITPNTTLLSLSLPVPPPLHRSPVPCPPTHLPMSRNATGTVKRLMAPCTTASSLARSECCARIVYRPTSVLPGNHRVYQPSSF